MDDAGRRMRVAVLGLPPLLADVIRVLLDGTADVEVGAGRGDGLDLAHDFARSGADVLVCAREPADLAAAWKSALAERPPLAVLNLTGHERNAQLYALYPRVLELGEITGHSLRDALLTHATRLHSGSQGSPRPN